MKCFIADVYIYSTCAFLIVMLIFMSAMTELVLFSFFLDCEVDVDVNNGQRRELVIFHGV